MQITQIELGLVSAVFDTLYDLGILHICFNNNAKTTIFQMTRSPLNSIFDFFSDVTSPIQELLSPLFEEKGVKVFLKREDLLDPDVSGNKFRKLKYNLVEAAENQKTALLTFGGAWSNHIAAVAAAGLKFGFQTIGIIRGEEPKNYSQTLKYAGQQGMQFHFVSRTEYRERSDAAYQASWMERYPEALLIPEGGTNCHAILGVSEMVDEEFLKLNPTHICLAAGTGGTTAGLLASGIQSQILSFSVLKGDFMEKEILKIVETCSIKPPQNLQIINDYHFGGYAKVTDELFEFMSAFEKEHRVLLDPVYTAKMIYGVFDFIKKDHFPKESKILMIHTGGLQGRVWG
jgi:1-aminocyclopropane-1-carboxylate deaminase/D-cysteine desulfhydrase-like pyridoxal-dependent ACC family enzyme